MNSHGPNITLLFSRLAWPSALVRERACTAIAGLLVNQEYQEQLKEALLAWLEIQKLESVSCYGLLAFAKATELDSSFPLPGYSTLITHISRPSILSNTLLKELYPDEPLIKNYSDLYMEEREKANIESKFFINQIKVFIPPIYYDNAKNIDEENNGEFLSHWALEWGIKVSELDITPSREPIRYRETSRNRGYLVFDTLMSEIYKSSYLRTLSWAIDKRKVDELAGNYYSLLACPVDLGLWKLGLNEKPDWWPRPKKIEGSIDTTIQEIYEQISEKIISNNPIGDDWRLSHATGRVIRDKNVGYSFDIRGLFQSCDGPTEPNAADIAARMRQITAFHEGPALRFEGIIKAKSYQSYIQNMGDWVLLPVSVSAIPHCTPTWQWWRMYMLAIALPTPFLSNGDMHLTSDEDCVAVKDAGGVIARWFDWNDGIHEIVDRELPPNSGSYLIIKNEVLDRFIEETELTYCHLCTVRIYHRKSEFELFSNYEDSRIIGATHIVRP